MKTDKLIYDCLYELYSLHKGSVELVHGIKTAGADWSCFQPSKFVYSFFAFNSIYSYDWGKSLKENRLYEWGNQPEKVQYLGLVDFCRERLRERTSNFYFEQFKKHLSEKVDIKKELNHIKDDPKTRESRTRFIPAFERSFRGKNLDKDWDTVLDFVYNVRCNIFHGTKRITDLAGEEEGHIMQRNRLVIYTAILQATNSTFFHVAGQATRWQSGDGVVCFVPQDDADDA